MHDVDGVKYPSVSDILKPFSRFKSKPPGPAALLGTIIHYHILKKYAPLSMPVGVRLFLDDKTANQRIDDALWCWREFEKAHTIEPILVEQLLINRDLKYLGKVDLYAKVDGKPTVVEIKTGNVYDEYYVQLAAYQKLVNTPYGIIVQVKEDLEEHEQKDYTGNIEKFINMREKYFELYGV